MLGRVWKNYIAPMLGRPPRVQIAALCHRDGAEGPEVLMVTSRETKRWIIPKGWPVYGTDGAGTALQEAWEEAGVKAGAEPPRRIGRYRYDKVLDGGLPLVTDVDVYAVPVERLLDHFPEEGQRERRWMPHRDAARLVAEEQLQELLDALPERLAAAPARR